MQPLSLQGYAPGAQPFSHRPFYVIAVEEARRAAELAREVESLAEERELLLAKDTPVIKSVEARNLERMNYYFAGAFLHGWADLVQHNKARMASLRDSVGIANAHRRPRPLCPRACRRGVRGIAAESDDRTIAWWPCLDAVAAP